MNMYGIAVEFWSTVAIGGGVVSFAALAAVETKRCIEWLRDERTVEVDSAPRSHASAPSHPGI